MHSVFARDIRLKGDDCCDEIRKTALRDLYGTYHWQPCKASAKFLMDLQGEFEDGAVFCSILEV